MPNYSHSKIGCYESCPRKFKFSYIDKIELPETPQGIEAFLGNRAHETLEQLYKAQKIGKIMTLKEMLDIYKELWDKNYTKDVQVVRKGFTPQNYYDSGVKQLTDYYERFKPFNQTYTLGLEMMIYFDLDDAGEYKINGFIDRLSHNGKGTFEIHDYKTGQSSYTQEQADASRQLALYQIFVEQQYPEAKEIVLIWHFLADNRDVMSHRTKKQINELKSELLTTIKEIEADDNFKPIESRLCDWCEFIEICPAKKHGIELEKKEKNEYLKDGGLVLVGKYAELYEAKEKAEAKVEAVEAEIEKLKEAIIAFAKKKDLSVVQGKEYRVSVKIEDKSHFPAKSEEGRDELEEIIRKLGKWDEVSDLNTTSLIKEYLKWDDDIIKKIKKYLTVVHKETVGKPVERSEED
jgi:putative RecB family exonuclease